jgi:hypothetical protein
MTFFRFLLGFMLVSLVVYTGIVISNHGLNLLPIFFGDIKTMGWPRQFNFDFLGFLILSGLWVSWRNHFSTKGLALGILAFFGGMGFLTIYLLVLSFTEDGDIRNILIGNR